ncbi:MAG TPA: flagella basal body P-ring formation protein FlgA, partial [Turneriella sp.]|nr:flagella basal body P-ring formation protein FlgA [Turneriella sp.]
AVALEGGADVLRGVILGALAAAPHDERGRAQLGGQVDVAQHLAQREAEKLSRYCRIEFKGARMTLNAKEIELHAWAAGVTPDKISGGPVTISMATTLQLPANKTAAPVKLRRGSAVQLVLKSEHMQIAREAALLQDAFAGETVDVRPAGTRKTLRAKLVSNTVAELVQ